MGKTVVPIVLALFLGSAGILTAEDFWTQKEIAEIDGYADLDGVAKLKFKDAVTARPVQNLTVVLGGTTVLKGDQDGIVQVPDEIAQSSDLNIPFTAQAPGYIPYKGDLTVQVGSVVTRRFVLSPDLPLNEARIVVEWGKKPADLDAWLVGPGFTVSYRAMKNAQGNATLDRDARNGYGPETITLLDIKPGQTYLFSVQNYSNEAPMAGVKVSFYKNNALDRVFEVPKTNSKSVELIRIQDQQVQYLVR